MKKFMVFIFGIFMGACLTTTFKSATLDVEAMVNTAIVSQLESLGTLSLNEETNEIVITLPQTSTNSTVLTLDQEEVVKDELMVEGVVMPELLTPDLTSSIERVNFLEALNQEVIIEESWQEEVVLLEEPATIIEELVSDTTPALTEGSMGDYSVREYHSSDLNIWIEKTQTDSQRYFWVEVENNSATAPLKSQLANNGQPSLRTVESLARQTEAILALNASGYYQDNHQVMGPIVKNGVSYGDRYLDLPTMVIGQDNQNVWTSTYQSSESIIEQGGQITLSFGPTLIENGTTQSLTGVQVGAPNARHPRTVIGRTQAGNWFFFVVDGRDTNASGMTLYEIQDFLNQKGVSYAYNLDGGGSTTLVFQGEVLNKPSDGSLRGVGDFIYFN